MRPTAALWMVAALLGAAAPGFLAQEDPVTDPAPDPQTPATVITTLAAVDHARVEAGGTYQEFLRVPDMSAGLYVLPAGARDGQQPHAQDEIYHVVTGRAVFVAEGRRTPVGPGSLLYVRTGIEHRFEDITTDLTVLVVFAGD